MKIKNGISGWLSSRRSLGSGRWRDNARRAAFSMIELLVVVVIILILTGVVYRISSYVTQRAGRAQAAFELELLRNALDEYQVVHGHYPPTEGTRYTDHRNLLGRNRYPSSWDSYRDHEEIGPQMPGQREEDAEGHGLYYYLVADSHAGRWSQYLYDDRMVHGVGTGYSLQRGRNLPVPGEIGTLPYSNFVGYITDPFGSSWVYEYIGCDNNCGDCEACKRPQSYILYSEGPPGQEQPIGKDRWTE